MLTTGVPAPDFTVLDQSGRPTSLSSLRGSWVVLWWYPEAGTSGCSRQAAALQAKADEIIATGAAIVGISFDPVSRNNEFSCDKELSFPLLSDPDRQVGTAYQVLRPDTDPHPHRPRRITYIIDPNGTIAYAEEVTPDLLPTYGEHILAVLGRLQNAVTG